MGIARMTIQSQFTQSGLRTGEAHHRFGRTVGVLWPVTVASSIVPSESSRTKFHMGLTVSTLNELSTILRMGINSIGSWTIARLLGSL